MAAPAKIDQRWKDESCAAVMVRFLNAAEIFFILASESMTYHPSDAY
jgi:hypothetical protein